jgi:hypothetical protein
MALGCWRRSEYVTKNWKLLFSLIRRACARNSEALRELVGPRLGRIDWEDAHVVDSVSSEVRVHS